LLEEKTACWAGHGVKRCWSEGSGVQKPKVMTPGCILKLPNHEQLIIKAGYFPYTGNVIIPADELIFFRGVGQPPIR